MNSVIHIISGLGNGGAEAVLYRLIKSTSQEIDHTVVSFLDEGVYGEMLTEIGVPVISLRVTTLRGVLSAVPRLYALLRRANPDVVQTWMYHADLIGGLIARMAGVKRVIWGIRHSSLSEDKYLTRLTAKGCSLLSSFIPSAITCNSQSAALLHQKMGYEAAKFKIIQNGYDIERFKPNSSSRRMIRKEWDVKETDTVIGLVARWNIQKDHDNLVQALSALKREGQAFRCVLVGPGMVAENSELMSIVKRSKLESHVFFLGPRDDVPQIMNGLDLHILSSSGESFPNVVAEAMACGVPCVSTDVGDASFIIGNADWVVPPKTPDALASAILNALEVIRAEGPEIVGFRCRQRIVDNFILDRMLSQFQAIWVGS